MFRLVLEMEAVCSYSREDGSTFSEALVSYTRKSTRRYNPEVQHRRFTYCLVSYISDEIFYMCPSCVFDDDVLVSFCMLRKDYINYRCLGICLSVLKTVHVSIRSQYLMARISNLRATDRIF